MSKICYVPAPNWRQPTIDKLDLMNDVVDEYLAQGFRLTIRQLYYQMVARGYIPNNDKEYAKISSLATQARMGGELDWDAILDKHRKLSKPFSVDCVADGLEILINQYALDRQKGQEYYIEVWCEKDALSSILEDVTSKYHVPLMVNKGYSSCSAMYKAHGRFWNHRSQKPIILYFGDHDPSGLDMIRDVKNRLLEFGSNVQVTPMALTMDQIETYDPVPNPAKLTDARASGYVEKHGQYSWELDALEPSTLQEILEDALGNLIDWDLYNAIEEKERNDIDALTEIAENWEN